MDELNREIVKEYGRDAGACVAGIAAATAFGAAPDGHKPSDCLEGCASVIVLGAPFPREALTDDAIEYIDIRNAMNKKMNDAAKAVAKRITARGYKAKAIYGMVGKYIDGMQHGPISLKHAAELAGLGRIGRNYLLTNAEHGNLLWFSAVLTDAALEPDDRVATGICDDCDLCVEACPSEALAVPGMFGKRACSSTCFKLVDNKWRIKCFLCRKVCPHRFGYNRCNI